MLAVFLLQQDNQSLNNEAEETAVTASWSMFLGHLRFWLKDGVKFQPRLRATHLYWMCVALRDGESERKREKCQLPGSLIDSLSHLPLPKKKHLKHQRKHKRLACEARPQPSPSITCTRTCINMSAFPFLSKRACLVHTAAPVLLQTF